MKCVRVLRIERDRRPELSHRRIGLPDCEQTAPEIEAHGVVLRLQPNGRAQVLHPLGEPPLRLQHDPEVAVRLRVAGIQTQRLFELRLRVGNASRRQIPRREHIVRGGNVRVEPDVQLGRRDGAGFV